MDLIDIILFIWEKSPEIVIRDLEKRQNAKFFQSFINCYKSLSYILQNHDTDW